MVERQNYQLGITHVDQMPVVKVENPQTTETVQRQVLEGLLDAKKKVYGRYTSPPRPLDGIDRNILPFDSTGLLILI